MLKFWFTKKIGDQMFDEHGIASTHDFSAFWKIIEHGLTAKDFAEIATVDNVHVREAIALMHGKAYVHPFQGGYAKIESRTWRFNDPCAIGFIDTNFEAVTPFDYCAAEHITDGRVRVAVNGASIDGPGGQNTYEKLRSDIQLSPKKNK